MLIPRSIFSQYIMCVNSLFQPYQLCFLAVKQDDLQDTVETVQQ